jgi:hypothetical protein
MKKTTLFYNNEYANELLALDLARRSYRPNDTAKFNGETQERIET